MRFSTVSLPLRRELGVNLEIRRHALRRHGTTAMVAADVRTCQRECFAWLAALWDLELGGILADDMGLGKTLQTLALVCHDRARNPEVGPFLVVAPTSVVSGWVDE